MKNSMKKLVAEVNLVVGNMMKPLMTPEFMSNMDAEEFEQMKSCVSLMKTFETTMIECAEQMDEMNEKLDLLLARK
mgnify:CR=1 FL=1